MNPILLLQLINGALALIEGAVPAIQDMVQHGEITAEEQQKLFARIEALRPGGSGFQGPEWKA